MLLARLLDKQNAAAWLCKHTSRPVGRSGGGPGGHALRDGGLLRRRAEGSGGVETDKVDELFGSFTSKAAATAEGAATVRTTPSY